MRIPASGLCVGLILSLPAVGHAETQPSEELLEFLADWSTEDGWVDPTTLSDDENPTPPPGGDERDRNERRDDD